MKYEVYFYFDKLVNGQFDKSTRFVEKRGIYEACCFYKAFDTALEKYTDYKDERHKDAGVMGFRGIREDGEELYHMTYLDPPQVYFNKGEYCESHFDEEYEKENMEWCKRNGVEYVSRR